MGKVRITRGSHESIFRKVGAEGGRTRTKKYSKEKLSEWGKLWWQTEGNGNAERVVMADIVDRSGMRFSHEDYVCDEFVMHGKRIQATPLVQHGKTVAREYEKRRRAELAEGSSGFTDAREGTFAISTERKMNSVIQVATVHMSNAHQLNGRPASVYVCEIPHFEHVSTRTWSVPPL